jgi:hypothetical protein
MRQGESFITVDGFQQFPEVAPQLLGGRFMVPLRAVAEATGATVSWDNNSRTVIITTGNQPAATPPPSTPTPTPAPTPAPTPTPVTAASMSVGPQTGSLTEGVSGTATYTVTTANMPNGTYPVTLQNTPRGVTLTGGNITVNNNRATLTITGDSTTQGGSYTATVRINPGRNAQGQEIWLDQNIIINIGTPQGAEITIGAQQGTLTQGTAGTATFSVTTRNLQNGNYNVTISGAPAGVTVTSPLVINSNSGTLTLNTTAAVLAGVSNMTFNIVVSTSGGQSVSINQQVTLTVVTAPAPTITGGTQVTSLAQTQSRLVTFQFNVQNTTNGTKALRITSAPLTGVDHTNATFSVNGTLGTFEVDINTNTNPLAPGTYTLMFEAHLGFDPDGADYWIPFNVVFTVTP